jgi:hypothetical protein
MGRSHLIAPITVRWLKWTRMMYKWDHRVTLAQLPMLPFPSSDVIFLISLHHSPIAHHSLHHKVKYTFFSWLVYITHPLRIIACIIMLNTRPFLSLGWLNWTRMMYYWYHLATLAQLPMFSFPSSDVIFLISLHHSPIKHHSLHHKVKYTFFSWWVYITHPLCIIAWIIKLNTRPFLSLGWLKWTRMYHWYMYHLATLAQLPMLSFSSSNVLFLVSSYHSPSYCIIPAS